jgi:hypothetical protein
VSAGTAIPAVRRDRRLAVELWVPVLAALAVFRIVLPLTTLAAAPDRMPLLPRYDGVHFNGDANGYYEAISNLFAAYRSVLGAAAGFAAPVLLAGAILAGAWSWRRGWHAVGLLLPAVAVSVGVTLIIGETAAPGAPVIGWSLAWAAALFPLPALGLELTPDRAFPVGVALGLLANSVTTVATGYVGLRASHRHSVGLAAAGLFATWPVWVGLVVGQRAWENGQWNVDAGLHLYTEPLSTMLVVVSIAALLGSALGEGRATASGLALGFATVVKLTNGLIGLALVPLVAVRFGLLRAALVAVGGIVSLPIVIAWWPRGYVQIYDGAIAPVPAYSLDYIGPNLRTSTIFTPLLLAVLLVPALVGIVGIDGWYARSVLVTPIVVTALAYTAYYVTNQHPRFFYVALPFAFVLAAAGVRLLGLRAGHLLRGLRS